MDPHTPSLKQRFRCVQSWFQKSSGNGAGDAFSRLNPSSGEATGGTRSPLQLLSKLLPKSSKSKKEQRKLVDALARVHGELAETTRLAEPDFAQLTRSLSKLNKTTSGLSALIEQSLSAVLSRLESIQVDGDSGAASQTLSALRGNLQHVHTQIAALETTVRRVGELQHQSENVRRIGSFLTACSLNFAVECARSKDTAQEFTAFCHDLRTLATNVAGSGNQFGEECERTHHAQNSAIKDLTVRLSSIEQLIAPAETAISATTRETSGLVKLTRKTLDLAAAESSQITRRSHDALYHLQLGDIIRQKWEHVCEAIEMAQSRAEETSAWAHGRDLIAAEIHQILAIQAAQMERMREEIVTAHRQLSEAFAAISEHTRRLARQAEALTSLQSDGRTARSLFATLETALKRLETIQTQGFEIREEAINFERQARHATTRLGDQLHTIRRINADIHLQSLNAIIRTCHLGDQGNTLGVLAMHMHGTFQESNTCVQQVIGTLKQVVDGSVVNQPEDAANAQSEGGACFYSAAGHIAELYEELHETATRAVTMAREQEGVLEEVRGRLSFLPQLAATIGRHEGSIMALQSELGAKNTAALVQEIASRLGQRYTMESEREIHRRIAQGNPSPEMPSIPQAVLAGDLDGIDFFDMPVAPTAPGTEETAKVGAEITDEDKNRMSPTMPSAPTGELPDLGDNVELF